jgi:putative ABC transport system substrate-binding protein
VPPGFSNFTPLHSGVLFSYRPQLPASPCTSQPGDTGYIEGRKVLIEYRWAEDRYDRVPTLVGDLIRRGVAVIAATGGVSSVLAAKAATSSVPIVFANGSDPVKFGVVERLNRPGGNITGATFFNNALGPKRLQVLRDVAPKATTIAMLVNPGNPNTEFDAKEIESAARSPGLRILRVNASSEREFDRAFATMAEQGVGALIVNADAFFYARRDQLIELATRLAVPAIYEQREFATAGGLMSYGASIAEARRLLDRQVAGRLGGLEVDDELEPIVAAGHAAEERYEMAACHSITSSASASIVGGTVRRSQSARDRPDHRENYRLF